MSPEDMERLAAWAAQQTCPACQGTGFDVVYEEQIVAKEPGTFSLPGQQMKVSATKEEVPVLVCRTDTCEVRSVGRRE